MFPPRELVELSADKNILGQYFLNGILYVFWILIICFVIFQYFWKFNVSHFRHNFWSVCIFREHKTTSFDIEKLTFMVWINAEIPKNFLIPSFLTVFTNLVFQVLNMIFQSYDLFGTRNRYYFTPRSLHVCFRSNLKFSKMFNFCHFS